MKSDLCIVAFVLSSIAIIVSLAQPTYNYLVDVNRPERGNPSFVIYNNDFFAHYTFTRIVIHNNGTEKATNIRVNLIFTGSALPNWAATTFIPEINGDQSTSIEIPIGTYHLESTIPDFNGWFTNVSSYEAYVHIECGELKDTMTFHYQNFIT